MTREDAMREAGLILSAQPELLTSSNVAQFIIEAYNQGLFKACDVIMTGVHGANTLKLEEGQEGLEYQIKTAVTGVLEVILKQINSLYIKKE